jgi:hypothetical protein
VSDEQAADFLPSARRAMRMAVEIASNPLPGEYDLERARVWILIAAELRAGSRLPAIPLPMPRPLDRGAEAMRLLDEAQSAGPRVTHFGDDSLLPVCDRVGPDDPEGCLVSFNLSHVTCLECLRIVKECPAEEQVAEPTPLERHAAYEQLPVPAEPPAWRSSDTEVIRVDHASNDGTVFCGSDNCGHALELTPGPNDGAPVWVHSITTQQVCPVSVPDRPHTFAVPRMDTRG